MAKKEDTKKAKGGGAKKKASGASVKKVSKEDLVGQMRKCKKDMQEMRFGLSKEAQKSGSRKNLRKQAARAAVQLTKMRKSGAVRS